MSDKIDFDALIAHFQSDSTVNYEPVIRVLRLKIDAEAKDAG